MREKIKKEQYEGWGYGKPKDFCLSALEDGCLWECWPGGARSSEVSKEAENLAF